MTPHAMTFPFAGKPFSPRQAILYGTLAVGTLDALDAMIFFGLRGAAPVRIFQSIASGLLGRDAYSGGLPAALLGVGLHYFIAFGIVTVYFLASRRIGLLTRHPVICGLGYGILAFFFMNQIVLPLSAVTFKPSFALPVLLNGLIGHAVLIGLPSAWFARQAVSPSPGGSR